MLGEEDVKKWAYAVIETRETPPAPLIELALSHGGGILFDNLNSIPGRADEQLAGRWLLADLHAHLQKNPKDTQKIAQMAVKVASYSGQPEHVYNQFNTIDDEVYQLLNDRDDNLQQPYDDLMDALRRYGEAKAGLIPE